MEYKDYYKTLGVGKAAGKEELKKQYRKLAHKYHPDVNTTDKNAAAKFGEISEAYNVLIDDDKRKKYDAFGVDWEQHKSSEQANDFDWSKYASAESREEGDRGQNWEDLFGKGSGASDFFKNIFGQEFRSGGGAQFALKGQDLSAELSLSLKEAYEGGTRILAVGANKIRIKLLPGIWDRQRIKISGKGSPGTKGAQNGDLYITFLILPDSEYRLDGVDLFKEVPVSIYSALLGADLVVHTISGKFELKIPPGTKNGTVFRLKGRGFPVYDKPGNHGDLFLKASLQLPEKLSEREKALFRELAAIRDEKINGGEK
jgi:curved DNA-binding protein